MRKLGVTLAIAALASACKAGPEPVPAEASAPSTAAAPDTPPSGTHAADPAAANPAPAATTDSPPAQGAPRVYGETTKTVSAKVGERFSVALPSNLTLPFKWRLDPPDAKVVILLDEKQHDEPPPGCGECVGYGGTRIYAFETKGAGTASLHFALKPLGNPAGPSQKEVTMALTVSP